jgi:endonuclease/exonuclease/phosphatase (EEP) superfamily protein YafD
LLSPQIDHVLFKGSGIGCVEAGVGAANGSDHRPVWARFRLDP